MKNEPAFPAPNFAASTTHEGMTLRDYFAAKAMQGTIASFNDGDDFSERGATWCYKVADMMLKAREAA